MANSTSGDSAIERLVRVLETFTPTRTVQTASDIARRAALPSSTAHRLVGDLVDAGLLERDADRRIRIGTRLWELATRSSRALVLRQAALPHMERVQARIREHTQLAVLEQDEALFLERLSAEGSGANLARIAGRLPLHASSSGLVLLAYADRALQARVLDGPLPAVTPSTLTTGTAVRRRLAEIRTMGHCVAEGSIDEGATGVAVPVRDHRGQVIAAISVVLPRDAPTGGAVRELLEAARRTSESLRDRA